jgi:hypothetical protein
MSPVGTTFLMTQSPAARLHGSGSAAGSKHVQSIRLTVTRGIKLSLSGASSGHTKTASAALSWQTAGDPQSADQAPLRPGQPVLEEPAHRVDTKKPRALNRSPSARV